MNEGEVGARLARIESAVLDLSSSATRERGSAAASRVVRASQSFLKARDAAAAETFLAELDDTLRIPGGDVAVATTVTTVTVTVTVTVKADSI